MNKHGLAHAAGLLWALALAAAGCRSREPSPASAPPTPRAEVASPASAPRPAPEPAIDPAIVAGSRALLLRFGALLLPFACYDAGRKQLARGERCRALVAAAPEVGLEARAEAEAAGGAGAQKVEPAALAFVELGEALPGFKVRARCAPERGPADPCAAPGPLEGVAVWPSTLGGLTVTDRGRAPAAPLPALVGPSARRAPPLPPKVARAARASLAGAGLGKGRAPALHQRLEADLDGDGKPETVWCVRVAPGSRGAKAPSADEGPQSPPALFFLFLERDGRLERMRVPPDGHVLGLDADAELLGHVDLDGDGAAEVWMQSLYFGGTNWLLGRWRGDRWELVASFTNGT